MSLFFLFLNFNYLDRQQFTFLQNPIGLFTNGKKHGTNMTKGRTCKSQKPIIGHTLSAALFNRWPQRFSKPQVITGILMEESCVKKKVCITLKYSNYYTFCYQLRKKEENFLKNQNNFGFLYCNVTLAYIDNNIQLIICRS